MSTETETDSDEDIEPAKILGGTLLTKDGGNLEISDTQPMRTPTALRPTKTGILFGPLEISAYPDSTARVGGLSFMQEKSFLDSLFDSGAGEGLFGTMVAVGSADRDRDRTDNTMTRRDLLKAAGLGLGAAAAVGTARASQTETVAHKAQFEAIENPSGIRCRIFDRTEGYLPTSETYYTFVDGQDYSRFAAASDDSYGDVVPQRTGTVVVGPEGAGGGFWTALEADKTVAYDGLPLPKSTTEAEAGEQLVISDNDILVEAAAESGKDRTTLAINGRSIPHQNEDREDEVGYFGVSDDRLVYTVGNNPPAGGSVALVIYANRSDEIADDAARVVQ